MKQFMKDSSTGMDLILRGGTLSRDTLWALLTNLCGDHTSGGPQISPATKLPRSSAIFAVSDKEG